MASLVLCVIEQIAQRRGWDLNPRANFSAYSLSRGASLPLEYLSSTKSITLSAKCIKSKKMKVTFENLKVKGKIRNCTLYLGSRRERISMFQQSFKQKVSPSFSIKLSALLGLAHLSNASPMSNNLWTRRFYHTKGLVLYLASGIAPLPSLLITR